MIKNGNFYVGESFYLRDGIPVATLNKDGNLICKGEIIDMHSCVAKIKGTKATRLNGFDYWYVLRNGVLTSIACVRENYRKTIIS